MLNGDQGYQLATGGLWRLFRPTPRHEGAPHGLRQGVPAMRYTAQEETPGGTWQDVGWFSRPGAEDATAEFHRATGDRSGTFRLVDDTDRVVAQGSTDASAEALR